MKPLIKKAISIAKTSPCFQRHAVLVFKGGALVSWACNSPENHAEVNALSKLWRSKRKNTVIISIRLSRDGKLKMAMPCIKCWQFMVENKISKVYYTTNLNGLVMWRKINDHFYFEKVGK